MPNYKPYGTYKTLKIISAHILSFVGGRARASTKKKNRRHLFNECGLKLSRTALHCKRINEVECFSGRRTKILADKENRQVALLNLLMKQRVLVSDENMLPVNLCRQLALLNVSMKRSGSVYGEECPPLIQSAYDCLRYEARLF